MKYVGPSLIFKTYLKIIVSYDSSRMIHLSCMHEFSQFAIVSCNHLKIFYFCFLIFFPLILFNFSVDIFYLYPTCPAKEDVITPGCISTDVEVGV